MTGSIPMIGTAVVNSTKWVKRLIDSVDYPVDEFLIINNNGRGLIDAELDEFVKIRIGHRFIKKIKVVHMPCNIGVPGAWNLMIKCYMKAPFWIITNDDIAFCPGFLKEMYDKAVADPSVGMIHGYQGDFNIGSWDLFLIRDFVIRDYGLFDESLYPAYSEDADYFMRLILKPIKRIMNLDHDYLHGDGHKNEYHTHGSQTRKSDTELAKKLAQVNLDNIEFLTKKWGPGWRQCQPWSSPYQDLCGLYPLSYSKFDLDFVRSKHLGF